MAILPDRMPAFLRIGLYRAAMILCCLLTGAPGGGNASTMQSDKKFSGDMAKRHERQEGPFTGRSMNCPVAPAR
jgi:hypothetical protein